MDPQRNYWGVSAILRSDGRWNQRADPSQKDLGCKQQWGIDVTAEGARNNLKKTSRNKGSLVVLMHDTKDVSDSSTILRESIEYLKSEGYEFKNFYNLLED